MNIDLIIETLQANKTSYVQARNAIVALGVAKDNEAAELILEKKGIIKTKKASKNFDDDAIAWLAEKPRTSKELYEWFLKNATPNKIRWMGFFEKIRKGINEVHSEKIKEVEPTKALLEKAKARANEKPGR